MSITSVAAAPRSTNCPHSFSLLQTVVHEHAAVPAHSPHASMRPACTIDNAGPVRWMSEVSLPTSVAYNAGTLVQHRSVECQRYRCLRALPTSHCDESLVRAIDNAGTLVQHRSVECQRYRCLRALPTSHCDESLVRAIDNAGTLVQHRSVECQRYRCLRALPTSHCDESLPTSHCDESLVRAIGPLSPRFNAASLYHRQCWPGPLDVRGIVAYERCLQCWHAGATPVR